MWYNNAASLMSHNWGLRNFNVDSMSKSSKNCMVKLALKTIINDDDKTCMQSSY